jgi:hypothetical protein
MLHSERWMAILMCRGHRSLPPSQEKKKINGNTKKLNLCSSAGQVEADLPAPKFGLNLSHRPVAEEISAHSMAASQPRLRKHHSVQ